MQMQSKSPRPFRIRYIYQKLVLRNDDDKKNTILLKNPLMMGVNFGNSQGRPMLNNGSLPVDMMMKNDFS